MKWVYNVFNLSNDEDAYEEKNRDGDSKYKQQGVEDEEGLKFLVESGEEEEEEAKQEEQEEDEDSRDAKEKKENNGMSCWPLVIIVTWFIGWRY